MSDGIATYDRPECAQVFFLFAGLGEMLMMNPIQFLKETKLSDRNVVLLKDAQGKNYRCGVSESVRSFAELVAWQQAYLAERPHIREVYVAGTSAGGIAALKSGHLLGAHGVWTFGARLPREDVIPTLREQLQVILRAKSIPEAEEVFRSMPAEWRDEFLSQREDPDRLLDFEQLDDLVALLSRGNGVTRYNAYYCARSPVDTFVANRLAGLPNVTVECIVEPTTVGVPIYDTGHNVLRPLGHLNRLGSLFPAYRKAT